MNSIYSSVGVIGHFFCNSLQRSTSQKMKCTGTISNVLVLSAVVFLPFTLQTIGLFTPHWVSNSTCDAVGLIYSCCSGINNNTCENTNGGNGNVLIQSYFLLHIIVSSFCNVKKTKDCQWQLCQPLGTVKTMISLYIREDSFWPLLSITTFKTTSVPTVKMKRETSSF